MGYVSYQEDNLNARVEFTKGGVRFPTKDVEAVKKYVPIDGQPLTPDVAETILSQFAMNKEISSWLTTEEWAEHVRNYHEKNRGEPPAEDLVMIIIQALESLFSKEIARRIVRFGSSDIWKLLDKKSE